MITRLADQQIQDKINDNGWEVLNRKFGIKLDALIEACPDFAETDLPDTEENAEETTPDPYEQLNNFAAELKVQEFQKELAKLPKRARIELRKHLKKIREKAVDEIQHLLDVIVQLAADIKSCVKKPGDISRVKKMSFEDTLLLLILMGASTTNEALIDFYGADEEGNSTVSEDAFRYRRNQITLDTMRRLFREYNKDLVLRVTKRGEVIIAIDGSGIKMANDPTEGRCWHLCGPNDKKGATSAYFVAALALLERQFLDAEITGDREKNEYSSGVDLMNRIADKYLPEENEKSGNAIKRLLFLFDRGFACANLYAQAQKRSISFVCRATDVEAARLLNISEEQLRLMDLMDWPAAPLYITRHGRECELPKGAVRRVCNSNVRFDELMLPNGDADMVGAYVIDGLRIIRFLLPSGEFENLITNLPGEEYTADDLLAIYNMRWNIETEFRFLKYIIGLTALHARKLENVQKEVWGRLILHNMCSRLTAIAAEVWAFMEHMKAQMSEHKKERKYEYRIDRSEAIRLSRRYMLALLGCTGARAFDVVYEMTKHVVPVRRGRRTERRFQTPHRFTFGYRY